MTFDSFQMGGAIISSTILGWWLRALFEMMLNRRRNLQDRERRSYDRDKNLLGRFRNAIEREFPYKFTSFSEPLVHPIGGLYLDFRERGGATYLFTIRVNTSSHEMAVSLWGQDTWVYSTENAQASIEKTIMHLKRDMATWDN